jgi:hypothetical protein
MPCSINTIFAGFARKAYKVVSGFEPSRVREGFFSTIFPFEGFYIENKWGFGFGVGRINLF